MEHLLLTFLLMGIVTYLPRFLPIALLSRSDLPPVVRTWLQFIPVAVLAALLVPELFVQDGQIALHMGNLSLLAALPTFAVALLTGHMALTIGTGLVAMAVLEWFL